MDSVEAQLARIKANIEARTKNSNKDAEADPLYNLADNTATKSHALSRAYYRLSITEKRCMEALISKLNPLRNDNDGELELTALEYAKAYNVPTNVAYRDIAGAIDALMHRVITADRANGKPGKIQLSVMDSAEYKDDEGKIVCSFGKKITPYLLGLREKFSSYPLKKAVDFQSSYTWRFYEILVSWAQPKQDTNGVFAGWIKNQSVDELREMLGVPDSYSWGKFDTQILQVSCNELRGKASISVFIERVKTSRKITHLNISFMENDQVEMALKGGETPKKKTGRKPKAA
jgi:plasmid replication initiation protein